MMKNIMMIKIIKLEKKYQNKMQMEMNINTIIEKKIVILKIRFKKL